MTTEQVLDVQSQQVICHQHFVPVSCTTLPGYVEDFTSRIQLLP